MIGDLFGQLAAALLGGWIADGFIGRSRANAAKRRLFLCGLRVLSGRQAGLSREWLAGEWRIRPGRLSLDGVDVPISAIVAGSRRHATLGEIVGGGDTVIVTVRTDTAELEWSMLRRFDGLAIRALSVPEVAEEPTLQ
ncbi:hypothetical protein [Agromyces allii]|uniref:DUF2550 family protein n=1 Tax=Agromyces allii TaxID=393607 RepID=A0ABP5CV27_9MICO|nr:hypothetical protein [Agromyces allii]